MFAYCNNDPVNKHDTTGLAFESNRNQQTGQALLLHNTYGGGGSLVVIAIGVGFIKLLQVAAEGAVVALKSAYSEVRKFSKSLQNSLKEHYDDSQPRVHHIVPWGEFSNRITQPLVRDMQNILIEVGIDPKTDPINMVILSQGYHKILHTNLYIRDLHSQLDAARGDANSVRLVLFFYALGLSFSDPYANGF